MKKTLSALLIALGMLGTAHAATYEGVVDGNALATDFSADGLIAFDLDFSSLGSTTLRYAIGAADLPSLSFNAVLRNFTGQGLPAYEIVFSAGGVLPGGAGTVTRQFGGASFIDAAGDRAIIRFTPLEFLDVEIGDPLALGSGRADWQLGGFVPGDVIDITVTAVPEPETIALLLSGLGVLLLARRRSRSSD